MNIPWIGGIDVESLVKAINSSSSSLLLIIGKLPPTDWHNLFASIHVLVILYFGVGYFLVKNCSEEQYILSPVYQGGVIDTVRVG